MTEAILAEYRPSHGGSPELVWVFRIQDLPQPRKGGPGCFHQTYDEVYDALSGGSLFGGSDAIWPVYIKSPAGDVPYYAPDAAFDRKHPGRTTTSC